MGQGTFKEVINVALNQTLSRTIITSGTVLIATGKHAEYARKVAKQFYQQRGIENPALLGERTEEVKDSTRYNPENGSLLTEPRPFNLMLKTYVGPVESEDNKAYLRPETAQAIFVQFKSPELTGL